MGICCALALATRNARSLLTPGGSSIRYKIDFVPRPPANTAGVREMTIRGTETMARIVFVELPAQELAASRTFYTSVFGWTLTDFGPTYSCTMTGDVDLGLQADMREAPSAPLPVVLVDDLEAALSAAQNAGATISKPIFAFPGGRRFQFLDPNGLELAIMQADPPA